MTRALFIPLKRVWFERFRDGTKRTEIRRYSSTWNERTCYPGRPVVLGLGYSGPRLSGVVVGFRRLDASRVPAAAREVYPNCNDFAAIRIDLT